MLDGETKPWQVQYDGGDVRPAAEAELSRPRHDELAKLRTLHEERQAGLAGEKRSPSVSSEKKAKEKKKKKRKEKTKKAEKEQSAKKGAGDEDGGALMERGQKPLSALYEGTCLDPDAEARSRLLKKAKRLGGKGSKKRKRSSSEESSDSSSSTESDDEEFGEGLFEERKRALRLTRRYPGSLAS